MAGKIKLSNPQISLTIDLNGGCLASFSHINAPDLNVLNFSFTKEQMETLGNTGAPFKGHFLCCPYWGSAGPSGNDQAPWHGPFAAGKWRKLERKDHSLCIEAHHQDYGIGIQKKIIIHTSNAIFKVEETIQNLMNNPVPFNLVQHPSLAAPFLNEHTVLYSNAVRGILQENIFSAQIKRTTIWPIVKKNKQKINISKSKDQESIVATFILPANEKIGWVITHSPVQQLLFGYCWLITDYPWLNIWKHVEQDKTIYTGLEFGTTGVHLSLQETMLHYTQIWNRKTYELLYPKAKIVKGYWSFLAPLKGVNNVVKNISYELLKNAIIIQPEMGKKITIPLF